MSSHARARASEPRRNIYHRLREFAFDNAVAIMPSAVKKNVLSKLEGYIHDLLYFSTDRYGLTSIERPRPQG